MLILVETAFHFAGKINLIVILQKIDFFFKKIQSLQKPEPSLNFTRLIAARTTTNESAFV